MRLISAGSKVRILSGPPAFARSGATSESCRAGVKRRRAFVRKFAPSYGLAGHVFFGSAVGDAVSVPWEANCFPYNFPRSWLPDSDFLRFPSHAQRPANRQSDQCATNV